MSAEVQPAIGVDPCPVLPRSDSLAAVAENTPHGGQSGRAGSGADSDADGLKSPEPWRVPIDNSRRKSRNGTRAADDRQPHRRSEGAKGADASDELAAVGQIDVVTPSLNRRACHGAVLALKRTCRVNEDIDPQTSKDVGQVAIVSVKRHRVFNGQARGARNSTRPLEIPATHQDSH